MTTDLRKTLGRARRGPGVPEDVMGSFGKRAARSDLVEVAYTNFDSPIGPLLLAATSKGLIRISFPGPNDPLDDIAVTVSPRILEAPQRLTRVERELDRYFEGRLKKFTVPVDWRFARGFAGRVLRATAAVRYGAVTTYAQVASKAGNPRASRAAGNALGANPVPIVVPCHRVLRTGGGLGGYGGGIDKKAFLLELEGVNVPND
jgi:methylated-DNA-[protein]-cysteine S-methyltransferase